MCKDDVIETKSMQSRVDNDLHEDVECKVSIDMPMMFLIHEHENVEMPSQSNVMLIVAYLETYRAVD